MIGNLIDEDKNIGKASFQGSIGESAHELIKYSNGSVGARVHSYKTLDMYGDMP
ncbi:MAG: hypothetical protein PHX08_15720 [Lachnospiraceae bacterium]|nr:hypothetical protein [Lachnospiraceae bacterium]